MCRALLVMGSHRATRALTSLSVLHQASVGARTVGFTPLGAHTANLEPAAGYGAAGSGMETDEQSVDRARLPWRPMERSNTRKRPPTAARAVVGIVNHAINHGAQVL